MRTFSLASGWAARSVPHCAACCSQFPSCSISVCSSGLKLVPLLTAGRFAWLFPLSLSFYCFQSLTYTIDLYFGEMQPTRSYLAYLGAALFFPSMTAGPIPRTRKLLDQLARPFTLTAEDAGTAFLLIAIGLVKKLLIADYLANNLVGRVFDTPALYSSVETLVGVYGYALQLFFDFSGYTDIAMGAALLLGIRLPENFRQPYLAVNVAEFWRRWHITFSEWLRDYLFDVLPKRRRFPVLSYGYAFLVTFTLGGLWHGISWNFLIWGVLHGLALGVVFAWKRIRKIPSPAGGPSCLAVSSHSTSFASPGYSSVRLRLKVPCPFCAVSAPSHGRQKT